MTVETGNIVEPAGERDRGRARRRVEIAAIGTWFASLLAIIVSAAYLAPVRTSDAAGFDGLRPEDPIDLLLALVLASMGALIVVRGNATRYGWLVLGTGALLAVCQAAEEIAAHAVYIAEEPPAYTDVAIWVQDQGLVTFAAIVLLLPSLFPDGMAVGRWRRPVRVLTISWALFLVAYAFVERPAEHMFLERPGAPDNPFGFIPWSVDVLNGFWGLLTIASFVVSIGSLRRRWREAGREQRQQLKWVLYALALAVGVILVAVLSVGLDEVFGVGTGLAWIGSTLIPFSWVVVAFSLGLGVLRYRLYDVDLVINRSLVYAAMSAMVILAYSGVVVGTSQLVPDIEETSASLLATGLIAIGFAPARARVQSGVDHLMFGRRDDPFGVLSDLGQHLTEASAPDEVLGTVVEAVVTSLKVPGAAIELQIDDNWETRAAAGAVAEGEGEAFPLRYQGVLVGRMVVTRRRRGEALHAEDHRLLQNIAVHAASLAYAVGLNVALQRSREQLVLAREEERRRLRRDLHDGLGPSLAAQTFRLDAVLAEIETDPAAAVAHVRALKEQNRDLVSDIRRLVYELRPPALDELGLAGALAASAGQLQRSGAVEVEVRTDPDPLGDLPAAVEVAAYRIAAEAITNVVRHAGASRCWASVERGGRELVVTIEDDGVGLTPEHQPGVGLVSMSERAAELGGFARVSPRPAGGTIVHARLPFTSAGEARPVDAPATEREFSHG